MKVHPFELLWLLPLAPVATALVLWPVSRGAPRAFVVVMTLLAWLAAQLGAALAFARMLEVGNWQDLNLTGTFQGARLVAHGPTGDVWLVADPLGALLGLAVAVAAGVALIASVGAWGGGPRATPRPVTSGQLLGLLLLFGVVELAALAPSLPALVAAVMLASVLGWALSSSADPKREQRDAAGQVFVLHRAGDAALLLALVLALASWGAGDGALLAERSAHTDMWERVGQGPFVGFPARLLFQATGLFLLVGVASRVPLLPLPMLYRQATGLPAPALALVHVVGGFALGVLVLLRAIPLWDRSEVVHQVALVLTGASVVVAALAAGSTRNLLRVDLHLLHTVSALAVLAALLGQMPAAAMLLVSVVVLAPGLLGTSGAVLEALHGRTDVLDMGGLSRTLKLSDRTRALSTLALSALPPFAVWLALERALFEALDGRFAMPLVAVLLLLGAGALTFAGFRALHLVYGGPAPRGPVPANLLEAPLWRALPALLVSLAVLAVLAVAALPTALAGSFLPGHQEPFQRFLEPVWLSLSFEPLTEESTRGLARRGLPASWRYAGMIALSVVALLGYALSAALYRKGPSALHAKLTKSLVPERTAALTESTLALERVFLSWLPAFASQAARVLVAVVLGVVLEGLVTRSVALAAAIARALIRLLHNGDVQRALFFGVLVAAAVLFAWGRT